MGVSLHVDSLRWEGNDLHVDLEAMMKRNRMHFKIKGNLLPFSDDSNGGNPKAILIPVKRFNLHLRTYCI